MGKGKVKEKGKEKGKKHKGLSERVHKKGGVPKNSQELEAPVLREEVKPAREVVSFHAPGSPRPAAREPRGLRNLGNTCYVNSVLQCLNAASPFVSALIDKTYLLNADAASRGEVTEEMAALVRRMRTEDADIDSAGLLEKVRRLAPQFEDSKQNDARSFLLALLEFVHEDVKGPRAPAEAAGEPEEWREEVGEASLVSENLYGLAGYTMECGGRDVEEKELFAVLSLPVPDGGRPELEGLFGMVERDCFECLGRHKARVEVVRQPPIWMVHLDRFGEKEKRETSVGYEHQFRGYQLQAVLHHSGSLVSGHYWAQVKMNGEWFVCNDAKVARIEERDVGSSNTAYILFYAKC
eukprot:TRINITY_DN18999_c1_g1_i1.p2 TRINITY_DN18999_c1_g1~~TRINITY_DN18999_c1_g1_i1.p2  ORF type:complete len:352 (-),score=54.16 TRINITY_DN18999_c1_g1_i1:33-1088(-)